MPLQPQSSGLKVGLFGIGLDVYWPQFAGLEKRLQGYVERVAGKLGASGCEVVNLAGVDLGVVQHFVETPAQALMVARGEREYWVPAVPQHLRRVDLKARRVVVDWDASAE